MAAHDDPRTANTELSVNGFEIPPPPEDTFPSEAEALVVVHRWTRDHNFNMTKRRAFYANEEKTIVWKRGLDCDRTGSLKQTQRLSDDDRVRTMRGAQRTGCNMKMVLKAVSKDDLYGPREIVPTRNGSRVHNHPESEDARVHACHRRRSAAAETDASTNASVQFLVEAQTAAGVSIASIRATLLQANPDSFVIPTDIANTRNAMRRRALATKTALEALFSDLTDNGFFYRYDTNPETRELRYLFWAHPGIAALYRRHHNILVVDCTYKTNQFKVLLFNIIAVTAFNSVLPVAQC